MSRLDEELRQALDGLAGDAISFEDVLARRRRVRTRNRMQGVALTLAVLAGVALGMAGLSRVFFGTEKPKPGAVGAESRIVFSAASARDGRIQIYAVNSDGSNPQQLTHGPDEHMAPAWSPDGTQIAFIGKPDDGDPEALREGGMDVFVMNADGTGTRRLTNSPGTESNPVWTPDGRIVFEADRGQGTPPLWIINRDGTGERPVPNFPREDPIGHAISPDGTWIAYATSGESWPQGIGVSALDGTQSGWIVPPRPRNRMMFSPAWSPDGTKLAYLTDAADRKGHNIVIVDLASGEETRIPAPGYSDGPSWSPDGSTLAMLANVERDHNELFVMNADGTNVRQLTTLGLTYPFGYAVTVSWRPISPMPSPAVVMPVLSQRSPEPPPADPSDPPLVEGADISGRVLLERWDATHDNSDIVELNLATGRTTTITSTPTRETDAKYSPDGSKILFHRASSVAQLEGVIDMGSFPIGLYVADADGNNEHAVLRTGEFWPGSATWSADGRQIVYTGHERNGEGLWIMDADGADRRRIVDGHASTPAWSPNGSRLVFTSARLPDAMADLGQEIFVVNADGSGLRRITDNLLYDLHPTWLPDGSIAFARSERNSDTHWTSTP